MTFGEKLKEARQNAKMSQEELSIKLNVSRSAVAKWETDKGLPDIQNLKSISSVLDVSIDYLLDDGTKLEISTTRESIDFSKYGKGRKKVIKDKIIREKYPDAEIFTLLGEEKLTKGEKIVDWIVFLLTPLVKVFPLAKSLNNLDNEFYLVNSSQRYYVVRVTKEFIESKEIQSHVVEDKLKKCSKFEIGNFKFLNCGPIIYA